MCNKMPTFINLGAVRRSTRVDIGKAIIVFLVMFSVLILITNLIYRSFQKCDGAFGDTVHLDLRKHQNYEKLYHGKCLEEYDGYEHAEDHKFPFIARFVHVNGTEKIIFCSGSLISESLILTAAHCLDYVGEPKIEIHLGGTAENKYKDTVIISRDHFTIILHPKYDANNMVNDIALVKLKHKIRPSKSINRICIPLQDAKIPTNLTLPVWDAENTVDHPKTRELFIPSVDLFNCSQSFYSLSEENAWKKINPTVNLKNLPEHEKPKNLTVVYKSISQNQFCAGEKTRKKGNSGMAGSFRSSSNGPYTIYGVLSYGTRDSHDMPTVFTKIYEYRHWILCNV